MSLINSLTFRHWVQMDEDEAQAFLDDHRENRPVSKYTAFEEPNTAPDVKRTKTLLVL